jgi:hypothetical protein
MFVRLFCVHLLLPLCRKAFLCLHEKRATGATRSTHQYYSKKDRGADMHIIPLQKNESYISYFFLKKEMDILTSTRVSIQDKIARIQEKKNTYAPVQLHLQWKKDDEEWD